MTARSFAILVDGKFSFSLKSNNSIGRTFMSKLLSAITAVFVLVSPISAQADNGLITKASAYPAETTTKRLEDALKSHGFMVFGRLNHAAAAKSFGLSMPYSTVVVFGNPKLGTPNFIKNPPLAIDLPLKALIWEDKNGKVWLSYNSSKYLYETIYARHNQPFTAEMVSRLEEGLGKLTDAVTKK
jgi:uncharacterized protein (DUF302 family)